MRTPSFGFVLVMLALLGRLMLPLAIETRAADPLANAPICTHDGSTPSPDGVPANPASHSDHCAWACGHAPPALDGPTLAKRDVPILPRTDAWPASQRTGISRDVVSAHRARGPPPIS